MVFKKSEKDKGIEKKVGANFGAIQYEQLQKDRNRLLSARASFAAMREPKMWI